jgi:hypothetical protein
MSFVQNSDLRRRRAGVNDSTTTPLDFEKQQERDEKIHAPGHWYRIYSIDSLCHTFVILSVIILAIDRITIISAQSRSDNLAANKDAAFVVQGDGSIVEIDTATTAARATTMDRPGRSRPDHLRDFPLNLEYLTTRVQDSVEFNKPPLLDLDLIFDTYNESISINDLPQQFSSFYNETPDFNTDWIDANVLEEMDMGGYVYTLEDFEDDDLADAYDYLKEYFSFDDDINRSPRMEEDGTLSARCRKPSWYRQHHPTCNKLHEVPILNEDEYIGYYIASGGYRDVFSVYDGDAVLKIALYERKYE